MLKARNSDVIDVDPPIKRLDSGFKIKKENGVDYLILDSDEEENTENKMLSPRSTHPFKQNCAKDSKPPRSVKKMKQMKQRSLFDSFGLKKPSIAAFFKSIRPFPILHKCGESKQTRFPDALNAKKPPISTFAPKQINSSLSCSTSSKPIEEIPCSDPTVSPLDVTSKPTTSSAPPKQHKSPDVMTTSKPTHELTKHWKEIKKKLGSPSFKRASVRDALLTFERNGSKRRGPNSTRLESPDFTDVIRFNPCSADKHEGSTPKKPEKLSKYGYPLTPPRYKFK